MHNYIQMKFMAQERVHFIEFCLLSCKGFPSFMLYVLIFMFSFYLSHPIYLGAQEQSNSNKVLQRIWEHWMQTALSLTLREKGTFKTCLI